MANGDDSFWNRIRDKKQSLDDRFERAVEEGYGEVYGKEEAHDRGAGHAVGERGIRPETFYSIRNYLVLAFLPVILAFVILDVNALAVVSQLWLLTIAYFWLRGGMVRRSQQKRAIAIIGALLIFFVVIIASLTMLGLDAAMLLWDIPFVAGLFVAQRGYEQRSSTMSGLGAVLLGGPLLIFLFVSGLGLNVLIVGYSIFAAALSFYFSASESVFYKVFTLATFVVWLGTWMNVILSMLAGNFLNLGFATMAVAATLTTVYMLQGSGRGDETAGGGGNLIATFEIIYGGFQRFMAVSGASHDRIFLIGASIFVGGWFAWWLYVSGILSGITEFIAVWGLFFGSLVLGPIHLYKAMHHGVAGAHERYRAAAESSIGGTIETLREALEELDKALSRYPDRDFEMGTEAWKVRKQLDDSILPAIRGDIDTLADDLERNRGSTTREDRKRWSGDLADFKYDLRQLYGEAQTLVDLMEESDNWSEDEVKEFDEMVSKRYSDVTTVTQRLLNR